MVKLIIRITLWSLLIGLISINIFSLWQVDYDPSTSYVPILQTPFSARLHMNLATTFWGMGYHEKAKQEISIAADLSNASVLGASTSPASLLSEWESQPKKIEEHYAYWKTIATQKPEYRDALIQLGVLAWQLGKKNEATAFLQQAYNLDPNFLPTSKVLSVIQ